MSLGVRSAAVLESLRCDLEEGRFAAGSRLPGENELCQRFQVSRNTVRKAVACLVADRRVAVRQGAGMYVLPPEKANLSSTVAVMGYFTPEELADLQVRALDSGHLLCVYSQVEAHWQPALERQFLQRILAERHRALLAFLSPIAPRNDDMTTILGDDGVRVVHMDHYDCGSPREGFMVCNYAQAGGRAAVELMLGGYEQVRIVRTSSAPFEELFERGFAAAMMEHGPGFVPETSRFDWRDSGGLCGGAERLEASLSHLDSGGVGIVCSSPGAAALVQAAAVAAGRRVPEDVGVIVLCLSTRDADVVPPLDVLVYDRQQAYQNALAAVLAPEWRCPREFQTARLMRRGSVRGRGPSMPEPT